MSRRVTAIVPARGGSQGIPRKNLTDLGGRPLLWWTLEAARRSGVVTRLIVSSDDDEILQSAADCDVGAEAHRRPPHLGGHDVHAVHVVLDLLEGMAGDDQPADVILMLLPTSPFRRPEDIVTAVRLLDAHDPPAVISVTELDKQLIHLRTFEGEALVPFLPWDRLTAQRQEQPPLYGLNGSVYAARPSVLRAHGTFHVPGAHGFPMPRTASLDINDPVDLAMARALLQQGIVP